jgi:hypothetical protein
VRTRAIAAGIAAVVLAAGVAACSSTGSGTSNGNAISNAQQANDDRQFAYVQPLPFFPFSQIRQTVIEAEAIDALGIASTTFDFVPGISHPVLECPSIGVPVPATDELSNPVVAQWNGYGDGGIAGVGVGQEEPDGVFPGDTSGTNGLCVNAAGGQYLDYDEAYDISITAPAYWDSATGTIKVTGTPVMPVCVIKKLGGNKAEELCTKPSS